jgi:hypothetical protein
VDLRRIAALACVLVGCARRDPAACLARCAPRLGSAEACRTLCSRDCAELRADFGIAEDACRALQDGGPADRDGAP